ncbi:MAG: serine phosphatase RsbU (regulator of sigma subunit) [Phenylobacterium sp.]|jgi:serine phosphatase RsbU (regulator of sigma subunit)
MNWQIDIATATRPRGDEAVGGDMMFTQTKGDEIVVVCIDALGHGQKAYEVARLAAQALDNMVAFQPTTVLLELNRVLAGGRGAAVAVCHINCVSGQMMFAGVGNISVRRIFAKTHSLISRDGVVGGNMRQPSEQQIALEEGDIYLLHTDGIQSRFSHRDYPQIVSNSATTAVAHILRHFSKQHDDAGCIVMKVKSNGTR